jgi:hypothetical protein
MIIYLKAKGKILKSIIHYSIEKSIESSIKSKENHLIENGPSN